GDRYPYLTISDFLEPFVIRTVFPIQKSAYFDGNFSSAQQTTKGFLLPIKKEFFNYFDIGFLKGYTPDGKPNLEMRSGAGGGLTVTLRVPVKKGIISFQRIYYPPANELSIEQTDIKQNKGVIVENQFTLTTFPFYRLPADKKQAYRVALLDRDLLPITKSRRYSLKFYQSLADKRASTDGHPGGHANSSNNLHEGMGNGSIARGVAEIPVKAEKSRSKKLSDGLSSHYYVLEDAFDLIEVNDGQGHRGMIIPQFKEVEGGTEKFTFAVDFGTT